MPSDNFTRANETPLASPWSSDGVLGGVNLASNAANAASAAQFLSYRTDSATNDVSVTMGTLGGSNNSYSGPAICCDGSGNAYILTATGPFGRLAMGRLSSGSYNFLSDNFSFADYSGAVIRLYIDGNDVVGTVNGSEVLRNTDTTLRTGYDGITANNTESPMVLWQTAGGGGGTTRGTPVGNRGTAFNGGRTLQGIIRRALWLPQPHSLFA